MEWLSQKKQVQLFIIIALFIYLFIFAWSDGKLNKLKPYFLNPKPSTVNFSAEYYEYYLSPKDLKTYS